MNLVAILADGALENPAREVPDAATDAIAATARLYEGKGFNRPWIGYLAYEEGMCVGTCAFKGQPQDGCVEIAYYTFPPHEGQGVASRMAAELIGIAARANPSGATLEGSSPACISTILPAPPHTSVLPATSRSHLPFASDKRTVQS